MHDMFDTAANTTARARFPQLAAGWQLRRQSLRLPRMQPKETTFRYSGGIRVDRFDNRDDHCTNRGDLANRGDTGRFQPCRFQATQELEVETRSPNRVT